MKNKVAALAAALSVLGGVIAAVPAMAEELTLFEDNFESCTVGQTVGANGDLNGWTIYKGEPEGSSSLTVEGDDTNKYLTVKRTGGWLGAGRDITVQTGMTYTISVKIKSTTEQNFNITLGTAGDYSSVTANINDSTVENEDGWKVITGTLNVPAKESNTSYSAKLWIQTIINYTSADYSIDDFKITYDDGKKYDYALEETFGSADSINNFLLNEPGVKTWDETTQALKITNRGNAWIGAGYDVKLYTGYAYTVEFDVKDDAEQTFSCDVGDEARVDSVVNGAADADGWKHCTTTVYVYKSEYETCTTEIWFQTMAGNWGTEDYTIDNIKIYRDENAGETVGTAPKFVTDGEINVETKTGTGKYSDETATGFLATIKNTGGETGSFNTVNWTVTSNGDKRKTGDKSITAVTLEGRGTARIALIVTGLGDASATATVTVK